MMIHELKCWLGFFQDIEEGIKTFEVRHNDRGFKIGDLLHIREFEPIYGNYTGRELFKVVTYVMQGGQFGIEKGFVVMGLGEAPETTLRYAGLLSEALHEHFVRADEAEKEADREAERQELWQAGNEPYEPDYWGSVGE